MRNLLAFVAALALTFLGVGWYLDWYKIQSAPASTAGTKSVQIELNTKKIGDDLRKGEKKLHQVLDPDSKKDPVAVPPQATPEKAPGTAARFPEESSKAADGLREAAGRAAEGFWNDVGRRLREEALKRTPK